MIAPVQVSVVIVNFNGEAYLGECLEAVGRQTVKPLEVVVVDNASSDGSCALVRSRFPEVVLIENATNRGFSGGCNDGTARSRGSWVVLLNPDTRPEPAWLEELLKGAAAAGPGDLVCSLVLDDDKPREHYRLSSTQNILGRLAWTYTGRPEFAFAAAGAAMIFEKSLYPEPFPEEYFLYHEDVFMSWRARLLGRQVVVARASLVPHRGSAATRRARSIAVFNGEKNRWGNFLTFWERRTIFRLLPVWALDFILHLPQAPSERMRAIVFVWRNRSLYRGRRRLVQSERKVPDVEILGLLSARVSPRTDAFNAIYNRLALKYCKSFGLDTLELRPGSARVADGAR